MTGDVMNVWRVYIDEIEQQICRDGFMTNAMRRNVESLQGALTLSGEGATTGRRLKDLVRRYNQPYVMPLLPSRRMTARH